MLIHDKLYDEGCYNFGKFSSIVKYLTKRQNVEFALYCAKDVFHLVEGQDKEVAKTCIDLVEKWLKDKNSVTSKELRNAAIAAWHSASYASVVVGVSAAGWAANAAATRANVAVADATVHAAYYAAWSASVVTDNDNKLNEYLIIANSYLTKTNINCPNYEIEGKILYLIDELEENIVIKVKDKYYVNMNEIERCPEYGFDTQKELLKELFNSKCLFWEFVRDWLDQLYKNQQA